MTQFITEPSRLLDRLSQTADADVTKADHWLSELATAKVAAAVAEERFTADFSPAAAGALAEATNRVRELSTVAAAVENFGGADHVRVRALRAPVVFSTFAKGFAERLAALTALVKPAARKLGERRLAMSEEGVRSVLIEIDPVVTSFRAYGEAITTALAAATFGETYSKARGANYEPRSFESLYAELISPLPTTPATSAN